MLQLCISFTKFSLKKLLFKKHFLENLNLKGKRYFEKTLVLENRLYFFFKGIQNFQFCFIYFSFQGINTSKKCWDFCKIVFDHLPFLSTASFFRISVMAMLITYLNLFGFVPIGIYWIGTLVIGYKWLVFHLTTGIIF